MITLARLKEVLHYDPDTGVFTWIKRTSNRVSVGTTAKPNGRGYVNISIDGVSYPAGMLAWLYVTGQRPEYEIGHKNGNHGDNAWINLRDVPHLTNIENIRRPHRDSRNMLGVQRQPSGKFTAKICVSGRQIYLGVYDTAELAHKAYIKAKREWHKGCTI